MGGFYEMRGVVEDIDALVRRSTMTELLFVESAEWYDLLEIVALSEPRISDVSV